MADTPFQFNVINTTPDTQVGQTLTWMSMALRGFFKAPYAILNACIKQVLNKETGMQWEDVSTLPEVQLREGKNPVDLHKFDVGKIYIPVDLEPTVGYTDFGSTLIAESVPKQEQFKKNCLEALLRYIYSTVSWVVLGATKKYTCTGEGGKMCYADFLNLRKLFSDQFALGGNYGFISTQAVVDVNTELMTKNIRIADITSEKLFLDAPVGRIHGFDTYEWPFVKQVLNEGETAYLEHNIFVKPGSIALGMKPVTDMTQAVPGVSMATFNEPEAGINFTITAKADHNPVRVEYVIGAKFGAGILDDRTIVDAVSVAPLPA